MSQSASPFRALETVLMWADDNKVNFDPIYCRSNPPETRYMVRLRPWENKPGKGVMYAACRATFQEALEEAAALLGSDSSQPLDFAWRGSASGGTGRGTGVGFKQLAF